MEDWAMPEGVNVELAHKLSEHEASEKRRERWFDLLEVVEVVLLAVVAISTAWSGFQATRWDGRQSLLYGEASATRFQADAASTYGGQELLADISIFGGWLQARSARDAQLQGIYLRRFTPDYRVAFDAWLSTDPFANPAAPAGPSLMRQYHNPYFEEAARLNERATSTFNQGTAARETADQYVRDTVLFATVLFLVAVAQRFRVRGARVVMNAIAAGLLAYVLVSVSTLPRL
jgi:hypothetical protein